MTINDSSVTIDESIDAKEKAQITLDNEKIEEILTYELAENHDLIDLEINLKRLQLNDSIQIEYNGNIYGTGYTLYLSEKDIKKVEEITGSGDYFKSYKDLSKSYIVGHEAGDYIRLSETWNFKK